MPLSGKQKRYLRGLAHEMSPVVRVGRGGLTPQLRDEADRSIDSHELMKVRIETDDSAEREDIAQRLANELRAEIVGSIGKIAILFRAREEDSKIALP